MRKIVSVFGLAVVFVLCGGEATHTVYLNSVPGVYPGCIVTGASPQQTGGGNCTDSYVAIQAVFSSASASNPLIVEVESGYLLSHGLTIPNGASGGHIWIRGRGWDAGFIAAKGCDCSVISNGYGYSPATTDTQSSDIRIENLTVNGYAGASCGTAGTCNSNSSTKCNTGSSQTNCTMDSGALQDVQLYNVKNVIIRHIKTLQSPTFAVVIGNYSNVLMDGGTYIAQAGGGDQNTDGLHFQGPGSILTVRDTTIDGTGDDSLCLCAPEGAGGDITDSILENISLVNAQDVMRIYSLYNTSGPYRVLRTTVRDVHGTVGPWAFELSGDSGAIAAPDNNDQLFLSNVNLVSTSTTAQGWFNSGGSWGDIVCDYCSWTSPLRTFPMFGISGKYSHITLAHNRIYRDGNGSAVQVLVSLNAAQGTSVKRLTIDDFQVVDSMSGTYSAIPALLDAQSGASVGLFDVLNTPNSNGLITALFTSGTAAQVGKVAGDITGFPLTIATLPTGAGATRAVVSNGVAAPALGSAVSTTGSTYQVVKWLNGAWVY